jgi:hypothetical protein
MYKIVNNPGAKNKKLWWEVMKMQYFVQFKSHNILIEKEGDPLI